MISYKIILHNVLDKQGKAQLHLQFFLHKKRERIPLQLYCSPKEWDPINQRIRNSADRASDLNLILEKEKARMNDIIIDARLRGIELTTEFILDELKNPDLRHDFLKWMARDIESRKGLIAKRALHHHKCVLRKLQVLCDGKLKFSEINFELLERFETMLLASGVNTNTLWNNQKTFKSYVNRAINKGMRMKNPFEKYKLVRVKGNRTSLNKEELQQLIDFYLERKKQDPWKNVLQYFLFACTTGGVRYGDIKKLNRSHIINGNLVFFPEKTIKQNKRAEIPLNALSYQFMEPSGTGIFHKVVNQSKTNLVLKEIATHLEIKKNLTFHVSRHTFATMFLSAGGQSPVLQKILLHGSIETTMVYEHITEETTLKENQMHDLADYISPPVVN